MIVVFRIGRAGNQMFQFAAIQAVKNRSEKVVYVGFEHLVTTLPKVRDQGIFIALPRIIRSRFHKIDGILKILARLRVLGGIFESPSGNALDRTRGLFPVTVFWGGWCQNEKLLDANAIIRVAEASSAGFEDNVLQSNHLPASKATRTCFVHVRRGDYATFPSADSSATLPAPWYREQMDSLRVHHPGISFFVFSDDLAFARDNFSDMPGATVIDASAKESFRHMASADHGILSPSSFSWWAARLAWEKSRGTFIAPDLWAGWNAGDWVPNQHVKSAFLTYRPVKTT